MNNLTLEPLLLSPTQVGQLLGISRSKCFEMISAGQLPPSYKIGRARKFKRSDLEKWLELGMPNIDKFQQLVGGRK